MSDLADPSEWELLAEVAVRTGPIDLWESIGNGENELLINRTGHKITIDASGSVRDCTPIHSAEIEAHLPQVCERMKRLKFVAGTAPDRRIVYLNIGYLRRRAVGPNS